MPSVWVAPRPRKSGGLSFRVMYRNGGRDAPVRYGGSFKSEDLARLRCQAIETELAAGGDPEIARRVSVIEWRGKQVGKVWRLKYQDSSGKQTMLTLGREVDGYTRAEAEAVAARFIVGQQANPLNPLLRLVDALVSRQERELGEALPHLYVAQTQIQQLHRLAAAELAANPQVFSEAAA